MFRSWFFPINFARSSPSPYPWNIVFYLLKSNQYNHNPLNEYQKNKQKTNKTEKFQNQTNETKLLQNKIKETNNQTTYHQTNKQTLSLFCVALLLLIKGPLLDCSWSTQWQFIGESSLLAPPQLLSITDNFWCRVRTSHPVSSFIVGTQTVLNMIRSSGCYHSLHVFIFVLVLCLDDTIPLDSSVISCCYNISASSFA